MAKHVIHISEKEAAATDVAKLLAHVRAGAEVVIEDGERALLFCTLLSLCADVPSLSASLWPKHMRKNWAMSPKWTRTSLPTSKRSSIAASLVTSRHGSNSRLQRTHRWGTTRGKRAANSPENSGRPRGS